MLRQELGSISKRDITEGCLMPNFHPDHTDGWQRCGRTISSHSWYFRRINRLNFQLVEDFIWLKFSTQWKIIRLKFNQLKMVGNFWACLSLSKYSSYWLSWMVSFSLIEAFRQRQILSLCHISPTRCFSQPFLDGLGWNCVASYCN